MLELTNVSTNDLNADFIALTKTDTKYIGNSATLSDLVSVLKNGNLFTFNFSTEATDKLTVTVSETQLAIFFAKQVVTANKTRSFESSKKWCQHISKGFLSMTHGEVREAIDATTPFKQLFDSLDVTKVERNGKGSKLYQLFIAAPTNDHLTILATNGFTNISPLLEGLTVVGLKVELPKQA